MKFYLGTDESGKRTLYPWEKDIPKGMKAPEIDIPTDKTGLMKAIQELLDETDESNRKVTMLTGMINAVEADQSDKSVAQTTDLVIPEPKQPEYSKHMSYTEWSCRIEDSWEKLSLAMKLHFAALAMEAAREQLPKSVSLIDIKGES